MRWTEPASALRVLIVEDNQDAADSLRVLVSLWGHDVRVARDGMAGLQAAREFQPQAVLLDIGLPRLNGYKVARRLRKMPGLEKVLLVATTGYAQESDRRACADAGIDYHFAKPVDLNKLQALLGSAVLVAGKNMLVVCAWCERVRGSDNTWTDEVVKHSPEGTGERVSHGICPACFNIHAPTD